MISTTRNIIVIDPALKTPESGAYNTLSRLFGELAESRNLNLSCLQFHLPFLTRTRLRDVLQGSPPAGIISLGSFANLTEHHRWIDDLKEDLTPFLNNQEVPFLGICFSHQLLAHMHGGKVGFLKNSSTIPNGKHEGYRKTRITHPKLSLIAANLEKKDYFSGNALDFDFQQTVLSTRSWREKEWESVSRKCSPDHRVIPSVERFLRTYTPDAITIAVRHEQEVLEVASASLSIAGVSTACPVDALVHNHLPMFSLQGHPETAHKSGDGWRILKNFIYYCDILGRDISRSAD